MGMYAHSTDNLVRTRGRLQTNEDNQDEYGPRKMNKKRKVILAGYDSDSSDGEDSAVDSEIQGNGKNDDGEVDMFAADEPNESKKSEVQSAVDRNNHILDYDEFDRENLADTAESSETKLSALDSGNVQIEAFNIEEEKTRGFFDKDGNYIETKMNEDDAIQDQDLWIGDDKDVERAAASQKRMLEINKESQKKLQKETRHYMIDEALLRLKFLLYEDETVLHALSRLNRMRNTAESFKHYVINTIKFLSDLIAILEQKGIEEVYSLRRPDIEKLLEEESLSDSMLVDDYETQLWNFKWLNKPHEIHGLYTNYQMQYWKRTYFNGNVLVRFRDEPDEADNWIHIDSLFFM